MGLDAKRLFFWVIHRGTILTILIMIYVSYLCSGPGLQDLLRSYIVANIVCGEGKAWSLKKVFQSYIRPRVSIKKSHEKDKEV